MSSLFLLHHYSSDKKKSQPAPDAPVRPRDQSSGSYQCVQAGEAAWQKPGVFFEGFQPHKK